MLLPRQGFGPEAKTRGGTLGFPACIHTRNFKKVRNVLVVPKRSRFDETRRTVVTGNILASAHGGVGYM